MLNSAKIKNSVLLLQIALILAFTLLSGYIQPPVNAIPPAQPSAGPFAVPVTIDTYGKAWDGYLAFGLWDYPYAGTSFLQPQSYLVVMTTKGQLLDLRKTIADTSYWPVKNLGNDTLMFEGEPETSTHFWNLKTNATIDFPEVYGHHDMIFNPTTNTFLTLRSYIRQTGGKSVLMDQIVELNSKGDVLWTWDSYKDGHFDLSDACSCNETTVVNGQTVIDLTHANSLQWEFQTNTVYMNMRHLDTFCKINLATNQTVWCLGEHGNFTLLDPNGKQVPSLWYHAHDVHEVQPGVFLMFDNEYHNTTMPCPDTFEDTTANSRILEVTINEQNRTARVTWSWESPRQDWTPYWGEADRLPNGDRLGTFGSQSHYLPGTGVSTPSPNSTGAVVVEVNPQGGVVRTFTFPYAWGVYRVEPISLQTVADYDGSTHTSDFTINLSTINDIGSPTSVHYRINNGPVRTTQVDGQPHITTEGTNNTLEYWSVDNYGIEQLPHNVLTGIKLSTTHATSVSLSTQSTPPQPASFNSTNIAIVIIAAIIVTISVTALMRRRKSRGI